MAEKKLFCERNPLFYQISTKKEILKRHLQNLRSKKQFAKDHSPALPVLVCAHSSNMIKRAPGVNLEHQFNKAKNIEIAGGKINGLVIHPGETFSFWKTVGPTTKRRGFTEGRVIQQNKLVAGVGGGLCNLAHTINLMVLRTPLTVTELHFHSDALAPEQGSRKPFASGTSISYNYVDYQFTNNTDQDVQLLVWCEGEELKAELRCQKPFEAQYVLSEEGHGFREENGVFYHVSKIYRDQVDGETGEILGRELLRDNRSKVMYDYDLIPKESIL